MSALLLGGPLPVAADDPEAFARAHVAAGYACAYCPEMRLDDAAAIGALRAAMARHGVVFAEAGAWRNLLARDPAERAANRAYVASRLALADELGAACCVDFLGTLATNSAYGPHRDNLSEETFALGVEAVRAVIDAVKPRRAKFTLEMMQAVIPDSVACYRRLIDAVDRPGFAVHVDPVNLVMTPRQYYDTGALIREIFRVLGPWIMSCHAKDIVLRDKLALHLDEVAPGLGSLDYDTYLRELAALDRPRCRSCSRAPPQPGRTTAAAPRASAPAPPRSAWRWPSRAVRAWLSRRWCRPTSPARAGGRRWSRSSPWP